MANVVVTNVWTVHCILKSVYFTPITRLGCDVVAQYFYCHQITIIMISEFRNLHLQDAKMYFIAWCAFIVRFGHSLSGFTSEMVQVIITSQKKCPNKGRYLKETPAHLSAELDIPTLHSGG